METKDLSITSLKPYPKNSRKHSPEQVALVAKSIKEFGFNQPIVVDEDNIILVGHCRLMAAKDLNLKTVPVLQLKNLNETQKKAYRILDNKLQNDSEWDFQTLELELSELEDIDFDLMSWGLQDLLLDNSNIVAVSEDEQGKLDEMEEKICPHCKKIIN